MVARIYPRDIHFEMLKSSEEGGFYGAQGSDGNVLISEIAMRRHWPNWTVRMTKRFKAMCVCNKYGVPAELSKSFNMKRMKIIKKLKSDINCIRACVKNMAFIAHVKKYKDGIMDGRKLKYGLVSKAIDDITCPPIKINGDSVHKFAYVIRALSRVQGRLGVSCL